MSDEPEDASELTVRCPLCDGTGTVTTSDAFQHSLQHQAALTSIGDFPDRLEILREDGAEFLSHLPDDVFAARESLCKYLGSARELMYFLGVDHDTCEVLRPLAYALVDLQRGVENPLFATKKKARTKSYYDLQVLICASAAITTLMKDGKSEDEAAQEVADKLKDNGLPLPDSYKTPDAPASRKDWERLQEWRRKCSSGRHGEWSRRELGSWVGLFGLFGTADARMEDIDETLKDIASKRGSFSL